MNFVHLELLVVFDNIENHVKVLKGFQRYHLKIVLRSNPLCHTLSKAFYTSKKTTLTSSPSSNDLHISWVVAINWLRHESPDLNPDWLGEIKLLLVKNVKNTL